MPQGAANPTIFAKAESGYEEQLRDLHSGVEGPPELAEVKGQCRSRTISAPTRERRCGMRSGMSELAWSSCRKYSRPQPHRAGLRQVQNSAPKGASANYEGSPTPAAKFRPPHAPHTSRTQERVDPKAGYSRRLSQRVRCPNPYLTRRARSHLPGPGAAPKLKACSRVLSSWPKIGTL
jgi:hypothetical protein